MTKLDTILQTMGALSQAVTDLKAGQDSMSQSISKVHGRIDTCNDQIGKLRTQVAVNRVKVGTVCAGIALIVATAAPALLEWVIGII